MIVYENSVAVLDGATGALLAIDGFGYDEKRDFFIVFLKTPLSVGASVLLSVDFLGNLNDQLSGFYRSSYTDQVWRPIFYIIPQGIDFAPEYETIACLSRSHMPWSTLRPRSSRQPTRDAPCRASTSRP